MHEHQLTRLIEVGRALVAELDLETLLERVVEAARELTGARYVALGVLDERRQGLERFITTGLDARTRQAIGDLPRGRGVLGVLIDEPRPLRLSDVGHHPRSYGFPAGHPPMTTFLGVPVLIRGEAWGNLYLTDKAGGEEFTADDEQAVVVLADWAAIAVENARLYRAELDRRVELERAVRGFEAASAIALALAGETDLERVLELIVKRGRALVEARSMVVGLVDGGEIEYVTGAGEVAPEAVGLRVALEGSVAGYVVRTQQPERLANLSSRLHFTLADHVQARAGLLVPLRFRGRTLGLIAAFDRLRHGPEFGADDERVMLSFAASAATAVATAQQVAARGLERAIEASEQERTRWARELHDDTLQELAGLKVLLSRIRRTDDREAAGPALDMAIERVSETIGGLRALITDLRPASLDELGVAPALRRLADRVGVQSELEIALDVRVPEEEPRLPPALENTIYRLVQEALSNVAKHAAARRAEVTVDHDDGEVRLVVRDDGVGFEPERVERGFGLIGMRERAGLLGGRLGIESAPGRGTTVSAVLPARGSGERPASPSRAA